MTNPNFSGASLVIGAATFGLALAVTTSVWFIRRKHSGSPVAGPGNELDGETGAGDEVPVPGEELEQAPQAFSEISPGPSQRVLPLRYYFLFVFVLAVPFWLFGRGKLPLPINLPAGALVTFVPLLAAATICYWQTGFTGVWALLKMTFDYQKIKKRSWYLPTLLLMPGIAFLSYAVLRLTGAPLPEPINIPLQMVLVFFILFFIGDAGEELGWSGYAIDPMQKRWGAFKASLILGAIWVIWHTIPWVQTGNPTNWIIWQAVFTMASRVLTVWIYNNTGKSVFAAILFHVMSNLSWSLFPNYGSHYNPALTAGLTWLAAACVALGWGASTLARFRFSKPSPA